MKTIILPADQPGSIETAASAALSGELIAFPTDTVYGLGTSIRSPEFIRQIFIVKERERTKAIPVLLSNMNDLPAVAHNLNPVAQRLAEEFWPGPLTIVVQGHPSLPEALSPTGTVGLRMPNHPVALSLMNKTGPLAVTSANLSGGVDSHTAEDVYSQLAGHISVILNGGTTPGGVPSTVIDCTSAHPSILRGGPITHSDLQQFYE